jgi:hypothetical protein
MLSPGKYLYSHRVTYRDAITNHPQRYNYSKNKPICKNQFLKFCNPLAVAIVFFFCKNGGIFGKKESKI